MKLRIDGIPGLCDAALVRSGNSSELICRVRVPAAFGKWGERFVHKLEFRATCRVRWTAKDRDGKPWDELVELQQSGFVD